MTRQEWLLQLRRCTSKDTLEKVIDKNTYSLSSDELETFNSAVDHRLAELTMGETLRQGTSGRVEICEIKCGRGR